MNSISFCGNCGNSFTFSLESRPSNFMELLRGNYVPVPEEAANYKQSVKDAEKALSQADKTISDIEAILDQLQSARKDIIRHMEQGSAMVSPIRRIPNEILESIFGHLAGDIEFCDRNFSYPDVWSVRQVCIRWKIIVTSTKSFWTHLSFEKCKQRSSHGALFDEQLVDLILAYSNNAPLHVTFDERMNGSRDLSRFVGKFVQRIAHRIQSLTLNPWHIPKLSHINDGLSLLEHLHINDSHADTNGDKADLLSSVLCFRNSPRLRSVEFHLRKIYPQLQLPWESLQKISVDAFTGGQLPFLRDRCLNLRDLKWSPASFNCEISLLRGDSLCFPNVEKFILEADAYQPNLGAVVLERLHFPVLKELEVTTEQLKMSGSESCHAEGFQTSFVKLLAQHSSTLQHLHITNLPSLGGSELLSMLAVVPQLQSFTYTLLPNSDLDSPAFYDFLTSQSDALVPQLEYLQVEGDELAIDSSVVDGLAYRRRFQNGFGEGPLKRLLLAFRNIQFKGKARSELERLQCDGLLVCINGVYSNWQEL